VQGHKWLREPKICLRLEQLQAEAAKRHNITVDTITGMLLKDHAAAHERGQVGAAVSASMGLAKLHGLLVEKHTEIPNNDPASFTTAQLEAIVRGGMTDAKRREIEALKKLDDPRTGEEAMQASKPKPH